LIIATLINISLSFRTSLIRLKALQLQSQQKSKRLDQTTKEGEVVTKDKAETETEKEN
jgi:hypothetical protein